MTDEEIKEAIDNMSEEELNEYVFFALKEMTKKCEKQQNRIEELQMTLARYTAQTLNADIKQMDKHKDDLEMLYKGCQIELEKKDKIIDEMAKWLYEDDNLFGFGILKEINTPEKIKEYFKKKVETEEK